MSIKQIAAIRRKPGLTHAEFSTYVRDVHGKLAAAEPLGVSRYVQNHVYDGAFGAASDTSYAGITGRDLVTELFFADEAAMKRTFTDPYVQTTIRPDGAKFNDLTTALSAVMREATLDTAPNAATLPGSKVFYFIKAAASCGPEVFEDVVRQAHAVIRSANLPACASIVECIANFPLAQTSNTAHFGGNAAERYDALFILRIAGDDVQHAFRLYQTEFERHCGDEIDRSRSFFLLTHEVTIF